MKNTKILVCCHKEDIFKSSDVYMPIHVGKAISDKSLDMAGDDTGDNISRKNASYCELTGMYWAWKNLKDVDYIGLCHYRRYFDFNHLGRKVFPLTTIKTEQFDSLNLDISKDAEEWLDKGGCIVAKAVHLNTSLYLHYCECHYSTDFKTLGDVIHSKPEKYLRAFLDTQVKSNKMSPFNMFLMSWEQFDKYCNWLFPLLKEVEDRLNISNYSAEQKRIFGYMGERLLNVYIAAEQLAVRRYPILKISDEQELEEMPVVKYVLRNAMRDLGCKILNYT